MNSVLEEALQDESRPISVDHHRIIMKAAITLNSLPELIEGLRCPEMLDAGNGNMIEDKGAICYNNALHDLEITIREIMAA